MGRAPGHRWRLAGRAAVLLAMLLLAASALLADPVWLRTLRHGVFDQYQRWQPRTWQDTAVRIVDIDEESLARIGQWPWPRTRMAELVARAQAGGAAAIGFDVVFAERDRTSPAAMADLWQLAPPQRAALAGLPDHDARFAQAIGRGGVVLGFSLLPLATPDLAGTGPAVALPETARYIQLGAPVVSHVPAFAGVVGALAPLAGAAAGHGALAFLPDRDGVVRRIPLLVRVGDRLLPSLVTEMLRVGQGETNYVVRATAGASGGVDDLRVGQIVLPTAPSGELWVHYAAAAPARTIAAWKLIEGALPPGALQGRLLLVGSSAQGLLDLRFNPLGQTVPGVEVHAQALEQALTDGFLNRPGWVEPVEALALVSGGVLIGMLALTTGPAVSAGAMVLVLCALAGAGWWAFAQHRLLLDPLTPALGILASFLLPSLMRHHASEKRRRWVAQAFSRYVSPNLVSHIVRHPEQLELGGRRQQCSFIFTDLANFTTLMESIDPAAAVGLLNDYLDGMIAVVFQHEGTLDRIIGDGIAVMFSAPLAQQDHRERAFACALGMQRFAADFAARRRGAGLAFGETRVGVHCGEVIVGNFGGRTMFDYRALGDAVNTASRLESVNKILGTRMCVSQPIVDACPEVRVRCVGRLVLKGKTQPLRVFQPVHDGLDEPADDQALQRYAQAFALMEARLPQALAAFEALALEDPAQPLVQLHLERLRRGESGDLIVLTEK